MNENYFKSFKGILKPTGKLKEEMKAYKEEEKQLEEAKMNRIFKGSKKATR